MLWDFAAEARMAFQLTFLRPFAVPRMADVLVNTGHITAHPERRAYDTGLLIHEIIADGLDGQRARHAISHMNRAHRSPGVLQEDLAYVLSAFVVVPIRYLTRVGWRPLLPVEIEATVRFYQRLGELMNIHWAPASYQEAADHFDDYEHRMIARSVSGVRLGSDVIAVLRQRMPAPARRLAGPLFASQLADDRVLHALGISGGSPVVRQAVAHAIQAHRVLTARRPAPTGPSFTPGQPAGRIYLHGYQLRDLTKSDL